jgi:spermidine synthase
VEPPAADFVPIGDPPLFIFSYDAADGEMIATPVVSTPEPRTILLLGAGLAVLAAMVLRRSRRKVTVAVVAELVRWA